MDGIVVDRVVGEVCFLQRAAGSGSQREGWGEWERGVIRKDTRPDGVMDLWRGE